MEAQCKGDGVASLIVAAGERRVGFENMMRSWVMKWGAQQGLGVVASQWLGGGKAKAQGRGIGWGAIACHHHHVLFRNCSSISAFCLNEKGYRRTCVLCTHIHEFLYISHLFHVIVISNIGFCVLDVIIGRHTWNCQIRTHIHTEINTHTHTQKQRTKKIGGEKKM